MAAQHPGLGWAPDLGGRAGSGQGRNVGAAEDRAEFPLAQRQPCLPSQPGSQEPVARLRLPGTWRLQSRAPGRHVAPGTELYPREKQTFVARPSPHPGSLRPIQRQGPPTPRHPQLPSSGGSGATISLLQRKEEPLFRGGGKAGQVPTSEPRVPG